MEKELVDYDFKSQFLEERKNKISERSEKMKFDEEYHIKGRLSWIIDLYFELDRFITGLKNVRREYLQSYIKYSVNNLLFAYIATRKKESLRVWAKISYSKLGDAIPLYVRDYEAISRRVGVLITFDDKREFLGDKEKMLATTFDIITRAFQETESRKERRKTPLKMITKVESVRPTEAFKPSLNLLIDNNGYIDIHFKIKKSQRELLDRILQETILK